ncbi:MAG: hypothetical protein HY365_03300 [Candidatus Aenigmarchaeota archaeon]|nr:hypothetical protein [Candidatus Aenigmarchaeota archaeon]
MAGNIYIECDHCNLCKRLKKCFKGVHICQWRKEMAKDMLPQRWRPGQERE